MFDPNAEMTITADSQHMNVDYNPYEGRRVRGVTETVLSRGNVIVEGGSFTGRPGAGQFIARKTRFERDALPTATPVGASS